MGLLNGRSCLYLLHTGTWLSKSRSRSNRDNRDVVVRLTCSLTFIALQGP